MSRRNSTRKKKRLTLKLPHNFLAKKECTMFHISEQFLGFGYSQCLVTSVVSDSL